MQITLNKIFNAFSKIHISVSFLTFIIAVFITLGFYQISLPGFYYDEVLYANALYGCRSLGVFDSLVIRVGNSCFPVLLMGYMGALKVFLLYPLKFFVNFENIYFIFRGFGLIVSAFSIFFLYHLNKSLNFKNFINFTTLLLFTFNMSFLFGSKYDWGPVTLAIVLKILLLLSFVKIRSKFSTKNILLYLLIGALGIYNKVDFAFIFIPLSVLLLFYNPDIKKLIIKNKALLGSYIFILFTLPLLFGQSILKDLLTSEGLHNLDFAAKFYSFNSVLGGTSVYTILTDNLSFSSFGFFLFIIFTIPFYFLFKKGFYKENEQIILYSAAVYYLILFLLPQSGGVHHFISTFPMLFLTFGLFINKFNLNRYLVGFGLLAYIFVQVNLYFSYQRLIVSKDVFSLWSNGSAELYDYLSINQPDKRILITDWGIANQQIILSRGELKIEEVFRPIRELGSGQNNLKIQNYDKSNSVAVKSFKNDTFVSSVENFDYSYYQNQKIISYQGEPLFIVYY